jgi:hypothetical protein
MNNATIVIAMSKEEVTMKTKNEIRVMLETVGVEMSNTVFKKTKKDELIAMLEQYLDPSKKVEIVTVEPVAEKKNDKKADALLAKWDKLVTATAKEYVAQSLGKKWALFYKNTKGRMSTDAYMVKTNKLFGATAKVIRTMYGEKHTNEDTIKQLLNVMVIRGYLNFKRVKGEKGENIIFSATADQMNAMWKLSK